MQRFKICFLILSTYPSLIKAWWVVSRTGREVIYADLWYSCNSTCYPVENSHSTEAGNMKYYLCVPNTFELFAFKAHFHFFLPPQPIYRQFRLRLSWQPFCAASASLSSCFSCSASNRERDSFSQLLSSCLPVSRIHVLSLYQCDVVDCSLLPPLGVAAT